MHLLRTLAASIILCLAALPLGAQPRIAPLHAPTDVTIYASLIYADDWDASWLASSDKHYGVHAISPTAPSFAPVSPYSTNLNAIGGGFYRDGHYYCMSYWTAMGYYYVTTLSEWDTTTWELVSSKRTEIDEVASDMTYDPVTKKVYGCFMKSGSASGNYSYEWGTLNIETAKREIISSLPERLGAVAADGKGAIYCIGASGTLYSIEPATGKLTSIGSTGYRSYNLGSGVIDERTGDFYWFCYPNKTDSYLFRVDTATAECTLIYELPKNEEFCGAYILPPAAEASAPDVVTDLAALFEGESLTGTVSFVLPTADYAGQPLSGTLSYTVEANCEAFTTGSAAPGESVSVDYTAPKGESSYTFTVYADNGEKGASSSVTLWIGGDAPCPVTDVRIARNADKSIAISWTAPEATVHGGNMLGLSYKVVRQPDGATIVERTTETSAVDRDVPVSGQADKFSYIIVPYNGSYAGKSVTSDEISVGTEVLPYVQGFDSEDDFNTMTVIDANHDGMTWAWHKLSSGSMEGTATCNTPEHTPQDDWLITPGFELRPGILYRVSFYPTCQYNYYKQKVAVALGTDTKVADMTRELIPSTTVTADLFDSPTRQQLVQTFTVDKAGTYYIGIHAVSNPDSYYLHVDNIVVEAASSDAVPAPVSDLAVTPDPEAALRATISCTAPSTTVIGNPLGNISRIEVMRGESLVHTFTAPAVGETLSWTDDQPEEGNNTYSITAFNSEGQSEPASATQWIGFDIPEAPAAATVCRKDGKALITWEAPTQGVHGGVVVPSSLTYDVLWSKGLTPVATGVTSLSVTDTPTLEARQELIQYYVCARIPNGDHSAYAYTNKTVYGEPYEMPILESFPAATSTLYPWFATTIQGDGWYSTWDITSKGLAPYSLPYDEDGGMAQCRLSAVGDCVRYSTPLLTLRDSRKPLLEFYYYYDQGSHDQLSVDISCEGGDYTQLLVIDYATQEGDNGWRKAAIDLSAYTDAEYVQVGFVGKKYDTTNHSLQIDHIGIREHQTCDLAITGIHAPRMMQVGDENAVTVTVANVGTDEVQSAEVVLYRDERQVTTAAVKYLAAGSEETVTLFVTPEVNAPEVSSFYAEVIVEGDANLSNNRSTTVQTRNKRSLLPAVANLAYEWADDAAAAEDVPRTALLSWSEPDLEGKTGVLLLDDFEDYEPFVIEHIGDWTLYDGTRAYTYGIGGVTYPHAYEAAAFQVFNPSKAGVTTEYWQPFSGDQILVSFDAATYDPTDPSAPVPQTDHWLISPLLPAMQQTVSFRTRSVTTTYGVETFQLLYNTSETTDPATFKVIPATPFEAPAVWTEITFTLPADARHFAIRHNSLNNYALLIDDIVYRSAEAVPAQLSLVGYNLYRDGQRLNDETLDDCGYSITFEPRESINHDYNVTALYLEGESAFSNTVNTSVPMGIENVHVDKSGAQHAAFDLLGRRIKADGTRRAMPSVIINDGKKLKY